MHFGVLNYEKQHKEGTCKVSGRSVVFSAFYADFCLCPKLLIITTLIWLVGFGFSGPLRQYFSLYRAVSQKEGERGERIDESKHVQTTPTRTYCKRSRPLPYCNQNCRMPRHWKLTQHYCTTRPPPQIS